MKPEKRRTPPMKIKLQRALEQLGDAMRAAGKIEPGEGKVEFEFDHFPALQLRPIDKAGRYVPDQHSAQHLMWIPKAVHREKTTGRRGESKLSRRDGDQSKIAKVKRIVKKREARSAPPDPATKAKPKAKIAARAKPTKKPQSRATGFKRRGV